jgi:hypothetical protein
MIYLKQSTASQEILLGPFLDETDGTTAMTGLTIANTDIKVFKAGATSEASKNSGGATHIAGGRYYAVLDATDTNTLGSGEINVHVATALPVRREFCILPANIYDSMILGTDLFDVSTTQWGGTAVASATVSANMTQISGDSAAADELERWMDGTAGAIPELGIVDRGTAQSATATTLVLRSASGFADDALNGMIVFQTGGTNSPQAARITDTDLSDDSITVAAWPQGTPGGTITYAIFGAAPDTEILTEASIRSAVGLGTANLDTQLASLQNDTNDIQTRIPTALSNGLMPSSVEEMLTDVVTADALQADAVAEVVTAVWAAVLETGFSADRLLRIAAALAAGKSEDDGLTIRNVSDTADQMVYTIDGNNRTGVTVGS